MKVEKLENLQNKIGSTGCKWSSLNAPGTETLWFHTLVCKSLFGIFAAIACITVTVIGGVNRRFFSENFHTGQMRINVTWLIYKARRRL